MTENKIRGKVWVFGNDIDTDVIIPGKYLRTTDMQVFADHVLEGIDPDFAKKVAPGDIVVAGDNFGCGSSREQAPLALKYAGVSCVVAASFARIFFRNSFNVGLPIAEAAVSAEEGDEAEIDPSAGIITIFPRSGDAPRTYRTGKMPEFLQEILADGGLVAHRKKMNGQ